MTQKDNVKQLIGKSLNAYNNKVLQQIDRIEKKNKQQNHKISMLTNELDNDYLTKTEEGSVISLEHSKEGMVYIDSLEGNTLVNYCTDGSKELTLNGDIDLEGTFVTTTEGVDNGKVDVMCEGNTLVNLKLNSGQKCNILWQNSNTVEFFKLNENSYYHLKGEIVETANILKFGLCYGTLGQFQTELLKPNTTYTLILNNSYDWIKSFSLMQGNATNSYHKVSRKISKNIYTITTKDSFEGLSARDIILYAHIDGDYKGNIDCSIIAMLEGDWSEKEIPKEYFEGMKSVGQDDENGHKIEILSGTISDLTLETEQGDINISNGENVDNEKRIRAKNFTEVKPNTTYELERSIISGNMGIRFYDTNKNYIPNSSAYTALGILSFTTPNNCKYIKFIDESNDLNSIHKLLSVTIFLNKKEILMNEPLRGLPSGDRDKFIKISGKLYIERNINEVTIDSLKGLGSVSDVITTDDITTSRVYISYETVTPLMPNIRKNVGTMDIICDKLPYKEVVPNIQQEVQMAIGKTGAGVSLRLKGANIGECETWLNNNPLKIAYALATPIYEPLEIEPTLNTYNDITHISNNSIIPCNMKVQNTGYNAIIKPSTLYTVALDTNKSGTIGMNLGGVKRTTTNNVLTLTTPATLTDDSLRLHGKGIKGSKVRLLEGDKTNWIPSHFEGMKSSFEDKLQDDGTYKMEILCNNKNLFDNSKNRLAQRGSVVLTYDENSKTYTVNNTGNSDGIHQGDWGASTFYDISGKPESRENLLFLKCKKGDKISIKAKGTFSQIHIIERNNYNSTTKFFTYNQQEVVHTISHECTTRLEIIFMHPILGTTFTVKDIQIGYLDKVFENYIENRHNKIQFSSIEPMRGINDSIRDKFVFKDNKLMIERNVTERIINGTEVINPNVINDKVVRITITHKGNQYKDNKLIKCDGFPSNGDTQSMETAFVATDLLVLSIYKHRLKEKTTQGFINWLKENPQKVQFKSVEPTYEEIPFELQKIILEGYENGTLFFDTNIPPTSTITYAGETPIVKSVRLNKTEVSNNTNDINDNIIPYLMDMDYRVVCLQLESNVEGISMAKLFGGVYEMLKRDILSKRLTKEEYGYRLTDYFNAGKLTEEQVRELEDLR